MTQDRLEFKDLFGDPGNYALRVRGHSLRENYIDDGDYVIIRKQDSAENGARVVAMIDDEVAVKRFHREKNRFSLEPVNGNMAPILVDDTEDVRILGVLVGVLRRY